MQRKNYEKWWSENLFSKKTHYEHLGERVRLPSIDEFSDSWMGSIFEKDRVKVRKNFKKYKSILDVGCGGSPEFYGIKNFKQLNYTGLDITPEIVEYNLQRGINCVQGSANSIPFPQSSFEVVHCRHVLEHMKGFQKPMAEMIRVAEHIVLISFFIEPLTNSKSIISLDNKDTEFEIYHNQYSKEEISEYLNSNPKVKKYRFSNLEGFSKTLLKINLIK